MDANKCGAEGPRGAWLSFEVTNTSGSTLNNVTIKFNGWTGGATTRPTSSHRPTFCGPSPHWPHVEKALAYYYVDYSEVCNHPAGGGTPYDGYTANYNITVSSDQHVTAGSNDVRASGVITDELITASAAGLLQSNTLGPGPFVGALLTQTVVYSFGNNSDLFFQPSGEAAFPEACLRLVGSKIVAVSGSVSAPLGVNRLHFPNASVPGGGGTITIEYTWETLCTNTAVTVNPWAAAKSGQKYKYSGFNPAVIANIPTGTQALGITKSVSPTLLETPTSDGGFGAGITQWTVTLTNTAPVEVVASKITDVIPSCMTLTSTFATGSGVTASNSATFPAVGSTGTQTWVGKSPGNSANKQYKVPANSSLTLVYETNVSACPTLNTYTNSATATVARPPSVRKLRHSASAWLGGSVDRQDCQQCDSRCGVNVVFTLVVTNDGPSDASGVSVSDLLPSGYSYVSDDGGGAYVAPTWTIGDLANGSGATLNVTALVLASGDYDNYAQVATRISRIRIRPLGTTRLSRTTTIPLRLPRLRWRICRSSRLSTMRPSECGVECGVHVGGHQ